MLPFPATLCCLQLGAATPFILGSWWWRHGGLPLPPLPPRLTSLFAAVSLLHALGMYFTALALVGGAVSFVHIVKASEPVFAAAFSFALSRQHLPVPVYLSLAPIVCGVCFASVRDMSFSLPSFGAALCSNTCYQLRVVLFKRCVLPAASEGGSSLPADKAAGRSAATASLLTPSLCYRVMTVAAFVLLVPIALSLEGSEFALAMRALPRHSLQQQQQQEDAILSGRDVLRDVLLAGACYFVYNEVRRRVEMGIVTVHLDELSHLDVVCASHCTDSGALRRPPSCFWSLCTL